MFSDLTLFFFFLFFFFFFFSNKNRVIEFCKTWKIYRAYPMTIDSCRVYALTCAGTNSKYVSMDGNDFSSTSSKVSSFSVPQTPRSEGEILQSSNLKSFSFAELKMSTRDFCRDSVLGRGSFGSVFKG